LFTVDDAAAHIVLRAQNFRKAGAGVILGYEIARTTLTIVDAAVSVWLLISRVFKLQMLAFEDG
jgi:hypothetical protein